MTEKFRVGGHWGLTIVQIGKEEPDEDGRRPDDRLMGMVRETSDAELIVNALNAYEDPEKKIIKE